MNLIAKHTTEDAIYTHRDILEKINTDIPLSEKLVVIHETLKRKLSFIDRIAVAIYDSKTDFLKTFVHSSGPDKPLSLYQSKLADSPSLQEIIRLNRPRVINDLDIFASGQAEHTRRINNQGYRSSYTLPIHSNGQLYGFLFFNSYQANPFNNDNLDYLDLFGHLIALLIINEQNAVHTLLATIKTANDLAHQRDGETGQHMERMARYSRLIAQKMATKHQLSDEYVEHVFLFAPLHDIGKISVPDAILHKPGKLTERERRIMQTHTTRGREIIDSMLADFGLSGLNNIDILRHIAEYHHEAVNGSGYPNQLTGQNIPMEARIVAVADVFDALTSSRPYKQAWSNEQAFRQLLSMAQHQLDKECVDILITYRAEVEKIQKEFAENNLG